MAKKNKLSMYLSYLLRHHPEYLYHGTNIAALEKIMETGAIHKMSRHAVHMQAEIEKAWQSAIRWKQEPVVLKIAAKEMYKKGFSFEKQKMRYGVRKWYQYNILY